MKKRLLALAGLGFLALTCPLTSRSEPPPLGTSCLYTLLDDSWLVDDCPICDRMPFFEPLRGTFELRLVDLNPLFATYAVENVWFTNRSSTGRTYSASGGGTLRVGGEVALTQELELSLVISNGFSSSLCRFTNVTSRLTRLWPMIQISAEQTNGTLVQQYHLDLNAAPLREVWFSPAETFEAGIWSSPTNQVHAGDLVSSAGRVVKDNLHFARAVNVMPPLPDLGLKDIDLGPGGEILFSVEQAAWSLNLGAIDPGDLLSDRGRIVRRNKELVAAFEPNGMPEGGVGLNAVHQFETGEVWFSVQKEFLSGALHRDVFPGDLLSDSGAVVRSRTKLLGAFGPAKGMNDAGLKSVFVWPSGEIWFMTASKFESTNAVLYHAGDLLSDQGYVVFRNSELLSAFGPPATSTNIALDALWIVSDLFATNAPPVVDPPQRSGQPPGGLLLQWHGAGRVFQLERSGRVEGPYAPIAPIAPDQQAFDPAPNPGAGFYRVRQW